MSYSHPHQLCWVYVDIENQYNTPLDAVGQWTGKARAVIDWDVVITHRAVDNAAIHLATPILTCQLYHPPRETEEAIFRRAGSQPKEAYQHTRELVENWLRVRHQTLVHLYCEYRDSGVHGHARFSTHCISFVSQLNFAPIAECRGTGRKEKEAKNDAARNLMQAGYCMIYGQFKSPRRLVC